MEHDIRRTAQADRLFSRISHACDDWWREQPLSYPLDFRDATVVVIGGECGTTAAYVLSRGARKVIAYERDNEFVRMFYEVVCGELGICDDVTYIGPFKGGRPAVGDILLVDCEGCEGSLDLKSLNNYRFWCVAVHAWADKPFSIMKKLIDMGAEITYITPDGREAVLCKK